jgi:gamma-glutamylcyclotransferase (GGCT)/AIG2-like uncharacterized protein YtfP
MLYFAYGTNMTRARMAEHCAAAIFVSLARLDGWKFRICQPGYATIIPQSGARVHGVLWQLGEEDFAALDDYEKVGDGLYRRSEIGLADGRVALVYLACDTRPGVPCAGYIEEIIAAARDWGLPTRYVQAEIARW